MGPIGAWGGTVTCSANGSRDAGKKLREMQFLQMQEMCCLGML